MIARRRVILTTLTITAAGLIAASPLAAQDDATTAPPQSSPAGQGLDLADLFRASGAVGIVIIALSLTMVALIVDHLVRFRRSKVIPEQLAGNVHTRLAGGDLKGAGQLCSESDSALAEVLSAGIAEGRHGYEAVEKAMEDTAATLAARMSRKIEYLSVIGTIAPMLGLLGTVWGMILAFVEFEQKANPQVSELAPGIYKALVTTLLGLAVAVPSLTAFALFRNRIDELLAEVVTLADRVFADFRRAMIASEPADQKTTAKPVRSTSGGELGVLTAPKASAAGEVQSVTRDRNR